MLIKFGKKFAEQQLDSFVDSVYRNFKNNPKEKYFFDFSEIEWISNQELLVFTALVKYFVEKSIQFEIIFFKKGIPINEIDIRVAKQLAQIWDVWKIWSVIPYDYIFPVFEIDGNTITRLKKLYEFKTDNNEIYDRFGITPFVSLEKIENYTDKGIEEILQSVYKLNTATEEIVYRNRCEHPFVNHTLSSIVTKELYENFLDHFSGSFFHSTTNWAFMSLSLKSRLNEAKNSKDYIQRQLENNFREEALPEAKDFFWDKRLLEYKNISYLQYSFLDFGDGIVETIKEQYVKKNAGIASLFIDESDVLKFAFNHDTSRHPIEQKFNKSDSFIPRGLFDTLSIVQRYDGLMIARSNFGKILYDFSDGKTIEAAFKKFGDVKYYFPGTLISIYLPAVPKGRLLDSTTIKPIVKKDHYASTKKCFINIYFIINKIKTSKKDIYSNLLVELREQILNKGEPRTIFFSFKGYEFDKRLARKIIFFLLSDYEINLNNNVIVIYPPSRDILTEINSEILSLAQVVKKYIVHPLPIVNYADKDNTLSIFWLGVYNDADKFKLNDLLFEEFTLASQDFEEPDNVVGHINYFDRNGNLHTMFPRRDELLNYYKNTYKVSELEVVKKIIIANDCLKTNAVRKYYLCNGNYYQTEFIELINLLNNTYDCNLISEILFRRLVEVFPDIKDYKLIGITSSSHKIITSLVSQALVSDEKILLLDNYHAFERDDKFLKVKNGGKFILICDAIATGFLAYKLKKELVRKHATLSGVGVIVDTIDENFEFSKSIRNDKNLHFIYLYQRSIRKYRREDPAVKEYLKNHDPIRINPFTNIPISLTIKETNDKRVLLTNTEFLNFINEDHIKVGFLKFNNIVHPYFFDTKAIISNIDPELLRRIFRKIKINAKELKIFYPKNSGMKYLDIDLLKNHVFRDHSLEAFELERFNTNEGWKFPHTTNHFELIVKNKSILILDDGSCTGDSLIQMIDELALFEVKEIVLLCLIGRINDHKREFFSRITQLKTRHDSSIRIEIYFGTHWHIPTYYLEDNPSTKEAYWLKEIENLQNTPENIKAIAALIQAELTPKPIDSFKAYTYLPKIKGKNQLIPKKELIQVREEIGKVIGYRFYLESFAYFNKLIRKYEGDEKSERNREMEILCATLIYEPYLYDHILQSMPDVVDKVEEFVDALIFGNPKKGYRKINLKKELTYDWEKKDILHLFFIVFQGEKLVHKLRDIEIFKNLISFIEETENTINYLLFKLLAYFPVNKKSFLTADLGHILHLLDISLQQKFFSNRFSKEVKIFRSFLSTLPSDGSYYSQLAVINENYRKLTDAILHKEAITVQYDILLVDLAVLEESFDELVQEDLIENWRLIANFIEPILSFAKSFPGFFLSKLGLIEGMGWSLRSLHGQLNDLINYINPNSEFEKIRKSMNRFKHKYLQSDSEIFKIFSQVSTPNILENILQQTSDSNINIHLDIPRELKHISGDLPEYLFKELIIREIVTNLRHRDKSEPVELSAQQSHEYLFIIFRNKIGNTDSQGGGYGLSFLQTLKKFPNQNLKYTVRKDNDSMYFQQELRIKKV